MSTLTISSNAKLNGTAVAARFTTITLTNVGVDMRAKSFFQGVHSHPDLHEPVTFNWDGRYMRSKVGDAASSLAAIAATFVARAPTRTLAGKRDAVVNVGAELCEFQWDELDHSVLPNVSLSRVASGYFKVAATSIQGQHERLSVVLYPVDRLRFVGSTDYLEPQSPIGVM